MRYWASRGLVAAMVILPIAFIAGAVRPLLGVAWLLTAASALVINGLRGTLAAAPMRPADADDPVSPPAIARTLHTMIRRHTIFLASMSVIYTISAIRTADPSVKIFATAFACAAFAAGPGTLLRRRLGLWAAGIAVVAGVLIWWLQGGRV